MLEEQLKELIIEELKLPDIRPEEIKDDDLLFGEDGLGLDSLDAVEVVVIMKRHFNTEVEDIESSREIFRSVKTLADYIREYQEKK
jgi:acyl carrier protein